MCISSRGNDGEITFRDWHPVAIIEYGYVAPDPLDPDIIYGAGRNEVSKYHWSTGQVQNVTPIPVRSASTAPIVLSPPCSRPSILTFFISRPTCCSRRPMADSPGKRLVRISRAKIREFQRVWAHLPPRIPMPANNVE